MAKQKQATKTFAIYYGEENERTRVIVNTIIDAGKQVQRLLSEGKTNLQIKPISKG